MSKKNVAGKEIAPNLKKLPLTEYFARLPKAKRKPLIISAPKEDLITAICEATERHRHTVRCWVLGYTQPSSAIEKKIVAELLSSSVDILFPES